VPPPVGAAWRAVVVARSRQRQLQAAVVPAVAAVAGRAAWASVAVVLRRRRGVLRPLGRRWRAPAGVVAGKRRRAGGGRAVGRDALAGWGREGSEGPSQTRQPPAQRCAAPSAADGLPLRRVALGARQRALLRPVGRPFSAPTVVRRAHAEGAAAAARGAGLAAGAVPPALRHDRVEGCGFGRVVKLRQESRHQRLAYR